MSAEEKALLPRLGSIHAAMTAAEVYKVLGEPTSDLLVVAQWDDFGGSQLSQLRIAFIDGRPRKLRWLKLGYFMYEKNL